VTITLPEGVQVYDNDFRVTGTSKDLKLQYRKFRFLFAINVNWGIL
jgi:hypothetical protein